MPQENGSPVKDEYGNHSCSVCISRPECPIWETVSERTGGSNVPNSCSFYWPPCALREPGSWYWRQLDNIAREIEEIKAGKKVAVLRKIFILFLVITNAILIYILLSAVVLSNGCG